MTVRRRYRRSSSPERILDEHSELLSAVAFGNPLPTFRAALTDDGTNLRVYSRQNPGELFLDTVFWDYFENGDPRFFDPFIQPTGSPDAGRLGAVELLVPGLYGIRASIDWDAVFTDTNVREQIGTNFDDSGTKVRSLHKNDFSGPLTIDQLRILWLSHTASEQFVEIVVGHTDSVSHTIPGRFAGVWAIPPMLTITYLGGLQTEPNFYSDV